MIIYKISGNIIELFYLTFLCNRDIIIKLSGMAVNHNPKKFEKVFEKLLTNRTSCDIIIKSLYEVTVAQKKFFEKSSKKT